MAVAETRPRGWTVLQVRRTFSAPRERVFEAWTDPELLRQWLTGPGGTSPHAEVDPRVGGEFRVTMTSRAGRALAHLPGRSGPYVHMVGRYLEINPPERLIFTLGWEDLPTVNLDREATLVTVEFEELEDGTEVVLTHERQPNRRVRTFHAVGWRGSLRKLQPLLERKPCVFHRVRPSR
jgi:uncharacterized protein YndB with AHSA1/START domain